MITEPVDPEIAHQTKPVVDVTCNRGAPTVDREGCLDERTIHVEPDVGKPRENFSLRRFLIAAGSRRFLCLGRNRNSSLQCRSGTYACRRIACFVLCRII